MTDTYDVVARGAGSGGEYTLGGLFAKVALDLR